MDKSLNILAIEPFYGGPRRQFLQALQRRSRHQWEVLHLPAVRYPRRLEVSGRWFAEVLARRMDRLGQVLFCTDALNLAELRQLLPPVAALPTVIYFHDNLLPTPGQTSQPMIDSVNLASAMVADEVWFNSLHHLRTFMGRAAALLSRTGVDPMPSLQPMITPDMGVSEIGGSTGVGGSGTAAGLVAGQAGTAAGVGAISGKARLMPPPVEINAFRQLVADSHGAHERTRIFVDTRAADQDLLVGGLAELMKRGTRPELVVLGPWGKIPHELIISAVDEADEIAQMESLADCGTYLSASVNVHSDMLAILAAAGGLKLALPASGAYVDLVPAELHASYLYEPHHQFLASLLQDVWSLPSLAGDENEMAQAISGHEAASAVAAIDWRLDNLA